MQFTINILAMLTASANFVAAKPPMAKRYA
jgi:hypothetical protein